MSEWLTNKKNTINLKLHIIPGARKSELVGLYGTPARIKIKLSSPPMEGAANKELIKFLAKLLGLSKSALSLTRGTLRGKKKLKFRVWD